MNEINITRGEIFDRTLEAIESGKKVVIHKGGTGSGKTYDIMVFLLFYFAANNNDWVITIVSESKPHLDIGAIRYAKQLIYSNGLNAEIQHNETRSFFTFPNGSIVEFFSADRIDKALGARRNVLYGNEINSLKEVVWDELARRSDYVIGDFNPTAQFWLEQWLSYYDDTIVIKSNYLDNLYLKETERLKIEKRASVDANFRRIHIDCEYGNYEGLVFPEITLIDDLPEQGRTAYGLDFGYTNDPASVIKVMQQGDNLYLHEEIYQTGLSNAQLAARMKGQGIRLNFDTIYADSAEPKSIDDLHLMGWNVKPAVKGKDSIMYGIDLMRQNKIHVTKQSVNLIKEFRNYSYEKDKNGQTINKPIDGWNHGIDAARYAVMMMQRQLHEYKPLPLQEQTRRL